MDPVAAQLLNWQPRQQQQQAQIMAMQQAAAQQQAQQRAMTARGPAMQLLYDTMQPGQQQGGMPPPPPAAPPPGAMSPGGGNPMAQGGASVMAPQPPAGGMPPPPPMQAQPPQIPPFRPMPSGAPPGPGAPAQVPPPPQQAQQQPEQVVPPAHIDIRSIVQQMQKAGVPPEQAADRLEALMPVIQAAQNDELKFFKAQTAAQAAAINAFKATMQAQLGNRKADTADRAEDRRDAQGETKLDQGQQRIDLAKQKLAKQAGGPANIVKWETDNAGNVVGGFTRSGKHIKLDEPGTAKPQLEKFDDEDKAYWTEVLRKGGDLPPGLARTAEGKALVQSAMHGVAHSGTKPEEMMANKAEYMGEKAGQRTLGTRTANIEMAATEAGLLSDLALKASAEWKRSGMKTLNDVYKAVESRTASPELRRFVAANTSFINAYARAINPQGVGTVADKEHAREMLEVGFSKGDYTAVIDQLQSEIRAAQESPGKVKASMRERFTGAAGQRQTATNPQTGEQVELVNGKWQPVKK